MFIINPQSGIPLYRQIIEQVRRMVAGGQLKPGEDLPSVREVALEHAINPMTISKAYSLLEAEGLLTRRRGKPMQVAPKNTGAGTAEARFAQLQPHVEQLVMAAKQLEISSDSLVKIVQEQFKKSS